MSIFTNVSRRRFLQLASLSSAGLALAACTMPGTAVAPADSAEMPAAGEVTELSLWMFSMNPELLDYINDNVNPEFRDKNPGFDMLAEHVPYDGYRQKLTTSIVGDSLPDVHEAGTQAAGRVATSGEGTPLDDYINGWDDLDDYYAANIKGTQIAGRTWGVPVFSQPSLTLYWKSVLEGAGMDPENPPATDLEYMAAAQAIQMVEEGRTLVLGGWGPNNWRSFFQEFEVQLQRLGGEMADESYTEVRFNTDKGVAALAWLVELYGILYPEGVARLPDEAPIPHFANKNIGMHMRGHGTLPRDVLRYNPDEYEDLGFAFPLTAADGIDRKNSISWRNFLSVSPSSADVGASVEWAHVFTQTEHNVFYSEWGGYIPVRKSALDTQFVKDSPFVGIYLEMGAPHGYDVINPPGYFELRQAGGNFFEQAALGEVSVEEAIENCAEIWQEGLDNAPPYKIP